jgi:CBS domain-containing protein
MGFLRVYDFVAGKVAWSAAGLPLEGRGPHYPLVGEVLRRDVTICKLGEKAGDVLPRLKGGPRNFCVVLNDQGILLGRLHPNAVRGDLEKLVEELMEPGPTTVRPSEPAAPLLERMEKKNVGGILVTTAKGKLLGVALQQDLRALVGTSRQLSRFAGGPGRTAG